MNNCANTRDLEALAAAKPKQRERSASSARFIALTYANLMGAVALFAILETILFGYFGADAILRWMETSGLSVVAIGMPVLCVANIAIVSALVNHAKSRAAHYFALAFDSVTYAALFVPILTYAQTCCDSAIIYQAIGLTVSIFAALSAAVFVTRANFSFLRTGLLFMGLAAIILILAAILFGFDLGIGFSFAMVVLMSLYVLYDTSNLIHKYEDGDDVVAALNLFGSLMTLFYYILRILGEMNRN